MNRLRLPLTAVLVVAVTVGAMWAVAAGVDRSTLGVAWRRMNDQPVGVILALVAFGAAFVVRSIAWTRILPGLGIGQAIAALHVALGANHVLPLRLGEPLRIVSVVRRTTIDLRAATASTVALRAADVAAIALIGTAAGLHRFIDTRLLIVVAGVAVALVVVGFVWLRRVDRSKTPIPTLAALSLTVIAWGFEAVVIYQVAHWSGLMLTPSEAVLVTSAAVVAQIAAVAPGGFGTYEAGGTAALVFLGYGAGPALAVVLVAHALKTLYSLVAGAIAVGAPAPSLLGRLRLSEIDVRPDQAPRPSTGPIVLFLPAHNEEGRVGAVVGRAPQTVSGHPVVCLVIDDGSSDATANEARSADAHVISQASNRGLGAAVRTGIAYALTFDPVAVAFCDADGEYAPEELSLLVGPILSGDADYVVGSRFAGEIDRMLAHRRFGNLVLTRALSWLARRPISDGQTGYRAFSPAAARQAEIAHDFNYAQVVTLDLLAKGFRYTEVPISYSFRTSGDSFVKLGRYLRAVIPAIWRELNDRAPAGSAVSQVDIAHLLATKTVRVRTIS